MPDEVTQVVKNLGLVTAYGYAKAGGYTGTEEEFEEAAAAIAAGAASATASAAAAALSETAAQAWATGGSGGTPSATNNAKYWAEQAAAALPINTALDTAGKAADALAVRKALLYEPVAINTFSITTPSSGLAEMGSTVSAVTLAYTLNKTLTAPETLTLSDGGTPVSVIDDASPIELTSLSISSETTYTLAATDAGSPIHSAASASKTAKLQFVNRVCWGVAASGTVDSAFVNALSNKVLSTTKARTISVNAGSGQYIWYCVPTRLGACTFKVGGFDGGFEAAQTVSVTNASGYAENYYVYRSTNANLGSTSVVVS